MRKPISWWKRKYCLRLFNGRYRYVYFKTKILENLHIRLEIFNQTLFRFYFDSLGVRSAYEIDIVFKGIRQQYYVNSLSAL